MSEYFTAYETMDAAKDAALAHETHNPVRVVFKDTRDESFGYFVYPENRYLFLHCPDECEIVSVHENDVWTDKQVLPSDALADAGHPELGDAWNNIVLGNNGSLLPKPRAGG